MLALAFDVTALEAEATALLAATATAAAGLAAGLDKNGAHIDALAALTPLYDFGFLPNGTAVQALEEVL